MSNKLISTELFHLYAQNQIHQYLKWFNSPRMVALREEQRRQWLARPWYERAYIRTRTRVNQGREWLGEKIAGREFDDY